MGKIVTVLLADDQTLFREGLKDLLEDEKGIKVVGEAKTGPEAIDLVRRLKPDVVLMDIKIPEMDGISATKVIREKFPQTNVIILSSYEDEAHITEAVSAGANGYLSKMLPASELVNALKTFTSESVMIPQPIMNKLINGLRQGTSKDSPEALTNTEMKVMALLGRGKSNKEIAQELKCSVKTVKNHLNSIFNKLGVTNRTEAVVKAIEKGLISPENQ
ncbi:MAG: response regulator transcription factor [Elusimicrobiales bacterium]|jgi:DNA-binding NarL/FixJ family response regulator|nr:response regulator transcription factor [Elusimicrobiales bacterium]HOJ86362.1 response regulator transcription factor [Elusimicrobiales bacterium]HOL61897.1 response regulator transcription factor [Elusimicrobiales bacterium]HPO94765.1 response regulator transcription factor [Elusimicrobiales bacterium]